MKEIKFRAWDKVTKIMAEVTGLKTGFTYDSIKIWYINRDGEEMFCNPKKSDIELMQYTGIKDKNGIDICTGDIVKCDYFTGVVEYRENAGIYVIGNKELEKCITFFDIHMGRGKVEVKGNIYENPELLEGRE